MDTLNTVNGPAFSDKEKAECLATTFKEVHRLPETSQDFEEEVNRTVATFLSQNSSSSSSIDKFLATPFQIQSIIKTFRNNKSPGEDKIHNILLKHLPQKSLVQITHIINSLIKLQIFPDIWKSAVVIPILKPKKPKSLPTSYRPISLLSTLSKVAERVLQQHISRHIEENNILPEEQFGFRPAHNSLHQVARLTADTIAKFNKRQHTAAVFMDIEKAFDRVWHNGLMYKMIKLKFPLEIVKIINSYLEKRKFMVRINDTLSNSQELTAGVPQGSVLAPILFNIYTFDIPKFPNNKLSVFADDTAFYASSFSPAIALKKLQNQFPNYTNYLKKWKIT